MAFEIIAGRSQSAREKYGLAATVFLGKHYVKMGRLMTLSNPIYMDVSGPHVVLVCGKRGSGKSYTLGTIAEGLVNLPEDIAENISTLIFDTMGIFWTMKYPNYRDDDLLAEWKLKPSALAPVIYVPKGLFDDYQEKGVPVDRPFAVNPAEVSADEWGVIFGIDLLSSEGTLIERAADAALEKHGNAFSLADIIKEVISDNRSTQVEKNIIENRFLSAEKWGVFSEDATPIEELTLGGQATILDLSAYAQVEDGDRIKALVIGLICKKILQQRMAARKAEEIKLISEGGFLFGKETAAITEKKAPLVWIMIDEAHEFLPNEGSTLSTHPLVQLLREGRQPGISLVLATQQPGKIHSDVITQADIVISHRITAKIDIDALNMINATYLDRSIQDYIDDLPSDKGTALLLDDKLEKIYPMRVRPRFSWHGGEDPTAIRGKLSAFLTK